MTTIPHDYNHHHSATGYEREGAGKERAKGEPPGEREKNREKGKEELGG